MAAASLLPDTKGAEQKASDLGADSTRIAWAFLSQYYSFLNKDPSRLHCFYTKRSTLIHSIEGADVVPCYGQQEIHSKIMELAFEDCKVYISNVDSQSSAEGGIIVQVLGEQSNRGGPWRKFSQTFFLAEQPNGYFVLNDICRFLKEEGVDEEVPVPTSAEDTPTNADALFDDASFPTPTDSVVENGVGHSPVAEAEEHESIPQAFGEFKVDEQAVPQVNGVQHQEKSVQPAATEFVEKAEAPTVEGTQVTETISEVKEQQEQQTQQADVDAQVEPEPEQLSAGPASAVEASLEERAIEVKGASSVPTTSPSSKTASGPSTSPVVAEGGAPVSTPAPTPTPAPAVAQPPAAPKSWASLAAANSNKWGSAATDKKGISSAAPASSAPSASSDRTTPAASNRPLLDAVLSINNAHCFVKGVVDPITDKALRDVLTSRFGPIREFDVIRSKACAFVEFERVDSARRAIQASMRTSEGGEGGIVMAQNSVINVVERKSPGDRPAPRPRGGAPSDDRSGGAGRGSYRAAGSKEGGTREGVGAQRNNTAGGEDGANRGPGAGRGGSKANRGTKSTKTAK